MTKKLIKDALGIRSKFTEIESKIDELQDSSLFEIIISLLDKQENE